MESKKLITVSYRLPERFSAMRSKLVFTPSAGGLATALSSYFENTEKKQNEFTSLHWIGISDISKKSFDKISDSETIENHGTCMHPVFLRARWVTKFLTSLAKINNQIEVAV